MSNDLSVFLEKGLIVVVVVEVKGRVHVSCCQRGCTNRSRLLQLHELDVSMDRRYTVQDENGWKDTMKDENGCKDTMKDGNG